MAGKKRNRSSAKKSRKASKQARSAHRNGLRFEPLEERRLLAVTSFQEGASGYTGAEDTILYSISPDSNFASETSMSPDQQDANGVRQGLLRFDNIIGTGTGQIPAGSTIQNATLTVNVVNSSVAQMQMSLYRMLTDWDESLATWNSFGSIGGVQASEMESVATADATLFDPNTGLMTFDVTKSVTNWAAGQDNFGWLIESAATDGWDFETTEASQAGRPKLDVSFTAPAGPGTIEFIDTTIVQAEGDSGTTQAEVVVSRLGGVSGAVSASYTVSAGTASGADFTATSGTVNFAAGQTRATFMVDIAGDTSLEGSETINIALSTPTGGATLGTNSSATLTIADDDALINEVLANVSPVDPQNQITDETNREYVELIGTPGESLAGYYFVIFEGQEEETAGTTDETGSGVADLVVDLSGQTFGANGLLVLKPTDWIYTADPDSNTMDIAAFDAVGGGIEDDSQTYALVRSSVPIVQGTDYDTIGEYVNTTRESVDSPLGSVGVLDAAPFSTGDAEFVDSVFVQNGGSDRDRAAVTGLINLPGVHIHQPTGASSSNNVTSDALSRREGNKIPNTLGAWFNGDIMDDRVDNPVIEYLNGTTRISVVAPDGSVLTPGATNTLRNVFVTANVTSVDEMGAPIVTFTVTRTGDTSQAIDVNFTTVDGTAQAGSDYVAQSGVLEFGIGEDVKTVDVQVLSDSVAEGFENFSLQLTSADSPFLITDDVATVTINDADVTVATFQNGINGYAGTIDTFLDGEQPALPVGGIAPRIIVDDAAGNPDFGGATGDNIRPQQGLLRFEDVFGAGLNQVPEGAQIFGGFVTVTVFNESSSAAEINFHRMLQDWNEQATWADPQRTVPGASGSTVNGVTPDGTEAAAFIDTSVPFPAQGGSVQIPLNQDTLQAWSNGTLDNFGWAIFSDSDSSWEFSSSEDAQAFRPELTILYTAPSGAGEFGFVEAEQNVIEGNTATVTVQRIGGSTGPASVDYSVGFGTASASDVTGGTSGTLSFADGELSKTFTVQTTGDTALETNETLTLTLNNGAVAAGKGAATLTIRDNDASTTAPPVLVSEILYNQPGNDGGAELFELVGTPGAALGGFYAVVIAGDVGADQGATDLVVDLGSFTNGANGTTLIGGRDTFTWDVPADTTFVGLEELNVEFLGGADNGTSTYALVYSPEPLFTGRFDYDWDNSGIFGNGLELPAGATIVDSIAIQDNSLADTTYGGLGNTIQTNPVASFDGVSRRVGNTTRNSASAFFAGDIEGSNDALVYDPAASVGLPSDGAAITPGLVNTGNNAQNPLVSVTSVDVTGGKVTIEFSGDVEQILVGDGTDFTGPIGPGISITQLDNTAIPNIDAIPVVSGFGTSTLELTFTGAAAVGGNLPAGTYNLNFVSNSVVANGRALDADGVGTPSNATMEITIDATATDTDFNDDNSTDGFDFLAWQRGFGKPSPTNADGDSDADGDVDGVDLDNWQADYGTTTSNVATAQQPAFEEPATSTASFSGNVWLTAGTALKSEVAAAPLAEESNEGSIDSVFSSRPLFWTAALAEENDLLGSDDASEEDEVDSLDEAFAKLAAV